MSAARAETLFLAEPPPRWPVARRIVCACGCGRWFYAERAKHRPPSYATPDCWAKARNERRRSHRRGGGEG